MSELQQARIAPMAESVMDTTEKIVPGDDLLSCVMSRYQNSSSPEHRHLCAVVGAMAQVLSEQGLSPSPVAYFAATMSALERQCVGSEPVDNPVTTALCMFLAIVLPKTSQAVLRSKGRSGLSILLSIAGEDKVSAGTLKAAFTCMALLLRAADNQEWPTLSPPFNVLVKHCVDQRPKVRKRAHECTAEALRGFRGSPSLGISSDIISVFFEKSFLTISSKQRASAKKVVGKEENMEALQILYLLNALKLHLPLMSGKSVGKVLMYFSKLLELRQPFLTRQILNTVQSLCMDCHSEIPAADFADLLERFTDMLSQQKKAADESMVAARVLTKGLERLYFLDSQLCTLKLPLAFNSLAGMLAFDQEEAVYAAADSMKSLIYSCLDGATIKQGVTSVQSRGNNWNIGPSPIERICITVASMLGYHYSSAWDVCLQVVTALFDQLGGCSFTLMADTVRALGDLEGLSDENLVCRRQLHRTVGAAVAAMGPEHFLTLLPLNIGDDLSKARLWLLPILRQNIIGAKLQFFSENVLALIYKLQERARKMSAEGKPVAAKKVEACILSLWALFPAFCNFPSDTAEAFRLIAKPLGDALNKETELRGIICHGLQVLIRQNSAACGHKIASKSARKGFTGDFIENKAAEARAKAVYSEISSRENLSAITAFSRNFLPLLFNIFISTSPEKRGDLQISIGDFASISESRTVRDFFITIMQKLLKATKEASETAHLKGREPMDVIGPKKDESPSSRRCIFMDLAVSLLKGLDDGAIKMLFTAIQPSFQDADGSVQKKGYKVLAGLCKEHAGFLSDKADEILKLMLTAMPTCHFSAKRHRLDCLHHLIFHLFKSDWQERDKLLSAFVGEIILATKEPNRKTRNTAYDILVQLGRSLADADPVGSEEKLMQYFNMIVGCLAGTTPHMKSAAVTGLARLIYEFRNLCHTIPDLLPSVLLLLHSKSREVIKSVLGFMKVVIARQPIEHLQQHVKNITDGLLLWSDDSKNHFKAKIRVIFEMLVRRLGFQLVSTVMPEEHIKLLTHIRKMQERKEKSGDGDKSVHSQATTTRKSRWDHTQVFSDDEDEADSVDEFMQAVPSSGRSRATTTRMSGKLRKSNKMLPEDELGGDEPLDLLDTQRTRSVLSSNKLKRKELDDENLEVDEDGRFIVPDDIVSKGGNDHGRATDFSKMKRSMDTGDKVAKSKAYSNKKRKTEKSWVYTGQEYANKKGTRTGDIQKQGKLDPYAYWPLDPKLLNRREGKKAAARTGLASVVKITNKLKGMSASDALETGWSTSKGKQKLHKGNSKNKGKSKGWAKGKRKRS